MGKVKSSKLEVVLDTNKDYYDVKAGNVPKGVRLVIRDYDIDDKGGAVSARTAKRNGWKFDECGEPYAEHVFEG